MLEFFFFILTEPACVGYHRRINAERGDRSHIQNNFGSDSIMAFRSDDSMWTPLEILGGVKYMKKTEVGTGELVLWWCPGSKWFVFGSSWTSTRVCQWPYSPAPMEKGKALAIEVDSLGSIPTDRMVLCKSSADMFWWREAERKNQTKRFISILVLVGCEREEMKES